MTSENHHSAVQTQLRVVVLAAGAGTRMKSEKPKMLHEVCGRTMLSHALHAADELSPVEIVAVVGHQRERVIEETTRVAPGLSSAVRTAVQEQQNGTGDAVRSALDAIDATEGGTVLVTNSDVPLLDGPAFRQLVNLHVEGDGATVTVLTSHAENPFGYGRIVRDDAGNVQQIVEEKDASADQRAICEVNSGVYCFDIEFLRSAISGLTTDNEQGELYLTDVIKDAYAQGKTVRGYQTDDAEIVEGVNDRVQLAARAESMQRRINEKWMRAGVTMHSPSSTWIDITATLGNDTVLRPNCEILGDTHIGSGCTIGPDTTLENTTVADGATVTRSHTVDSMIGADATVGPYGYMRPGSQLGDSAKVGTFVETKNSTIGNHTKIPHLTYVGDATIGEYTNIGASSVFVNYDGVNKFRTTIGDHVRTGSDTMFIAPVTIGDGAYSGAGTVIKDDVPPGALAVSSGPQRNIEGWVEKKRPGTGSAQAAEDARKDS